MKFEKWLSTLLDQSEENIRQLLTDETALHFLIAWSLFESKCFSGYVKAVDLERFAKRIVNNEGFDVASIKDAAAHFHARYQDAILYNNLIYGQSSLIISGLLAKPFDQIAPDEVGFLVLFTAFRYRNNIFHGNKGVDSWLRYREQILHCINAMQLFVNHAESINPTLKLPR